MKKLLPLILLSFLFSNSYSAIWYVNLDATGTNNGTSWTNAYKDLQNAIGSANFGDQIWVAKGTYKPTTTTTRTIYFNLKNGVAMYGGFVGTETLLTQKNPTLNPTILSGNIGSLVTNTDNSYRIIYCASVGNQTRLDGFTITEGYSTADGGGIYVNASSPIIANCKILNNRAAEYGGGLYTLNTCNLTITNCGFYYNSTGSQSGGGIYTSTGTNLTITDSDISNNQSGAGVGGIFLTGSTNMNRCVIAGNSASGNVGGIQISVGGTHIIANTLIIGNIAQINSAGLFSTVSDVTMINCTVANNRNLGTSSVGYVLSLSTNSSTVCKNSIVWGNQTNNGSPQLSPNNSNVFNSIIEDGQTGGTNVLNKNPLFVSPGAVLSAPFDTTGLNYHLLVLSPAIDYGNNSYASGINLDLDSNTRILHTTIDLGVFEADYCVSPVVLSPNAPLTVCSGTPLTLSVPGATQYAWSTGSTGSSINITSGGNYSVTIADTAGCRGFLLASVTASQSPTPVISYATGNLTTGAFSSYQWSYNGNTIPGADTQAITPNLGYGTYSVSVTNAGGCVGNSTYCYSPVAFFASGSTSFCAGGSVTLSVINGNGFSWSNGEIDSSITVTTAGNYTVTVQSALAGCSISFQQAVTVNTNPNPSIIYSNGDFHTGSFASYQWYFNGTLISGATSMDLTPTNGNGQYTVAVTNAAGCEGTSSAYNLSMGISENDKFDISVYPNPVLQNEIINIRSANNELSDVTIYMIDITGKKVYNKTFGKIPTQISIEHINPGVYILTIDNKSISKNYRLIVL